MVLFIFIQILIEQSVSLYDQGRTGCLCPTELALGLYGLKHFWGRGGGGSQRTKPSQLNRPIETFLLHARARNSIRGGS